MSLRSGMGRPTMSWTAFLAVLTISQCSMALLLRQYREVNVALTVFFACVTLVVAWRAYRRRRE